MTGYRPGGTRPTPSVELPLKRRLIVTALSGLATLAVAVVLVAIWAVWVYRGPGPKTPDNAPIVTEIRAGAGLPEIAATLERAGVVRSASIFMTVAQVTGSAKALKAGEYAFPSGASMDAVLAIVRKGKVVRHRVTIPEGVTSETAAAILAEAPELTGVAPTAPEGALLPETYDVRRGDDRAAVLQKMLDAQDRLLQALWEKRQPNLPIRSPEEAVILASIVEKETGLASERRRIAAVFVNRLRLGMRLESDPTIIYGLTRGKPLGRGIRMSELQRETPYNTYKIDGLPPTPIANPGREALAAVLDPAPSNELFFVADGTGGHVFAATLEEHERNVARWRAVERSAKAAQGLAGGR